MYASHARAHGLAIVSVAIVAVVALLATGVASADPGDRVPAPPGFVDSVVAVYRSEYQVVQALGRADTLETVAQYRAQVLQAPPEQLSALYDATRKNPGWSQIPSLMESVAAHLSAAAGTSPAHQAAVVTGDRSVQLMAAFTPDAPLEPSAPVAPSAVLVDEPIQVYTEGGCASAPDPGDIMAAQIAIDVGNGVFLSFLADLGIGIPTVVSTVGAALGAATVLAASIANDILLNKRDHANECGAEQQTNHIKNIDDTTVAVYNLLAEVATTVTELQSTSTETVSVLQSVKSMLVSFEQDVEQSLSSVTRTLQSVVAGNTQTISTQLETLRNGLQSNLATIVAAEATNSQTLANALDKSTSSLKSSAGNAAQQALREVDTTALGLTNLVKQGTQQILNTLQSNFATGQSEYNVDLKLDIEHALASGQSQVQMKLPASMGGYLNSSPVGVAEVVNDDIHALQSIGATLQPSVLSLLAAANASLANGQWLIAFANFMKTYQSFAGA